MCLELLGFSDMPKGADEVDSAFRSKSKACHPDKGGRVGDFQRLVAARDTIKSAMGRRHTDERAQAESTISKLKSIFRHATCFCRHCVAALTDCSQCPACLGRSGAPHVCNRLSTLSGHHRERKWQVLAIMVHEMMDEASAIVELKRRSVMKEAADKHLRLNEKQKKRRT